MKRRIAAALLITLLPLGMSACLQIKTDNPTSSQSSSSAPSQEPTSTPTQASPSASSSSKSSQTKEEACAILDDKANKVAANKLADSAQKLLDATKAADDQPTAEQRSRILSATSEYLESMNNLQTVCTGK